MAYEHKPGQVSVFKNTDKTSDNQPDYKGYGLDPEGNKIEIALWVKEGKEGKKFFSGKLDRPRQQQQPAQPAAQQPQRQPERDSRFPDYGHAPQRSNPKDLPF